ncbi:interleukin-2 receptor subunit alpha isoform X1 [Rousettus aegyptiacus]|uniref:interleukin-2 receptor subunit alpha isoform X1 n=1 Tax=Rousettus aegyptiacus TaxID=9407 RepID=UPI00168CD9D2|nr:interleukin-2 receptor subunit alpha isoform X1 [Rousettus aegyptiacus]
MSPAAELCGKKFPGAQIGKEDSRTLCRVVETELSARLPSRQSICPLNPPVVRDATFKALTYEVGTRLNCECKRGFRRISNGSAYMKCAGHPGHSSWENQCQCVRISRGNSEKRVTPKPEEPKGRKTTDGQSRTQPTNQAPLPGHCREPPPWDHEDSERIYHFVVGQAVHYECAQGFRALQRGPATSVCEMTCGKTRWTRPQIKCVKERQDGQLPGDEELQASTDTPEHETSCPFLTTAATTDFPKQTEAAATAEPFLFTTEYQIAVACCAFLLVSTLLLSGLAWWRRR